MNKNNALVFRVNNQGSIAKDIKLLLAIGRDGEKKIAKRSSLRFLRLMKLRTPKLTGTTAKAWRIDQRSLSAKSSGFSVSNNVTINKHYGSRPIVDILDQGRGPIRPRKARRLYVPLTNKGRSKRLFAKIPKNLLFGQDYVLAKRVRAVRGSKFIDTGVNATKLLMKSDIKKLLAKV